ncbi:MAG: EI24 domain-containing protein [Blastocatellia bacterium]|nr:EI24 domain-containing protein [Blastocatellia bacterium]
MREYNPGKSGVGYHFISGVRFFFAGLGMLFRHPALLALSLIPILATILMLTLLAIGAALLIGRFLSDALLIPLLGDGIASEVRPVVQAIVFLFSVLFGYFLYLPLARVLLAPFAEAISRKAHQISTGSSYSGEQNWRRAILDGGKMAMLHLVVGAGSILLGLAFPPLGVPVGVLIAALLCSLDFMDVPLSARGLRFGAKLRVVFRNKPLTMGFGFAAYVMLLIPVVNLLTLPVSVIGATLLTDAAESGGRAFSD